MEPEKIRVLCVDDESAVLEGLVLHLRRRYRPLTCTSGQAALELLEREKDIAVILSDMRMPGMTGAEFLARSCVVAPDASRMLLTGQTDLASAIQAINEGKIFRFLTKPCQPADLLAAFDAASEQHRLRTAEKVLLEQTLRGAVRVLVEVLGLTNPDAFGRSLRIRKLAAAIATEVGAGSRWQLDVAAMVSHLGYVALPQATVARILSGETLTADEQAAAAKAPQLLDKLLSPIPRLEEVREILSLAYAPSSKATPANASGDIQRNVHILRVALELSRFEAKGSLSPAAFSALRKRLAAYPEDIMVAATKVATSSASRPTEVRELKFSELEVGMTLVDELRTSAWVLIVPKGFEVTQTFLARIVNFPHGSLPTTVRALVRIAEEV
jgi:CheY-like chemotaxis protein